MNNNYFVKIEENKNHLFIEFQISNFIKIILLIFFLLVLFSCESRNKNSNPNVIIIITDDQGYGDLGVHGNKIIKTPNIDKFSAESVNFSNYHVGTTCSPTRAGLMTGRNCLRNGVWHTNAGCSLLNQEEKQLQIFFQKRDIKQQCLENGI